MSEKNHSDFWAEDYDLNWDFSEDSEDIDISGAKTKNTAHLIRLSAARRAISNYVTILTSKIIPVMFNDGDVSMTDGSVVYIGADVGERENFDVAVGLALHEGSHICYSDFNLFKSVWQKIPREIYEYTEVLNINKEKVAEICRTILNIVEDRYIDYTVYTNAPGYRGYYQALYDKYFNSTSIDDGLKSNLYRTPSIDSYFYRLINITNINTDLDALPGLREIAKCLDLENIDRLDTPNKRLEVALQIADVMFKNITSYDQQKNVGDGESTGNSSSSSNVDKSKNDNQSSKGSAAENLDNNIDDLFGGSESDTIKTEEDVEDAETSNEDPSVNDIGNDNSLSKTKQQKIKNAFKKQKGFLSGDFKKKKMTKRETQVLNVLEQSKIELVDVGSDYLRSQNSIGAVECILVKKMTRELIHSQDFPIGTKLLNGFGIDQNTKIPKRVADMQKHIDMGISMGIKLAKRIQFRNEVNTDKFSRRETGKIDKRLLHELGFAAENVFYTTTTHKYKNIKLHISVDASSSMIGDKWNRTMCLCTTIAKAASMLDNVHVTVSFRTTSDRHPYIVIGYDSAVDKFSKIKTLFAYLRPNGFTPEGLCFEALMRTIPQNNNAETESYFINISDGEPYFTCFTQTGQRQIVYSGEEAAKHTQTQIKKVRALNHNVLSYFVSDERGYVFDKNTKLSEYFRIMYGKDAVFVNVSDINQITNTINKKLLESVDS